VSTGSPAPYRATDAITGISTTSFVGVLPALLDTASGKTNSAAGGGVRKVVSAEQAKRHSD
jgi:hypothetical protein